MSGIRGIDDDGRNEVIRRLDVHIVELASCAEGFLCFGFSFLSSRAYCVKDEVIRLLADGAKRCCSLAVIVVGVARLGVIVGRAANFMVACGVVLAASAAARMLCSTSRCRMVVSQAALAAL